MESQARGRILLGSVFFFALVGDRCVIISLMNKYLITMLAMVSGCFSAFAEDAKASEVKDIRIVMTTSRGDIEATIFASKVPMTAANYLNLAKRGYYDGLKFHRVIANFMIQGGDPQGTGRGGPGYRFGDEFDASLKHDKAGVFSMANAGPGTNGSQFFITHGPTPHLNGKHSVYGEVTKGLDVVNAVRGGDTIKSIKVLDSTDALFAAQKANLDKWNAILGDK